MTLTLEDLAKIEARLRRLHEQLDDSQEHSQIVDLEARIKLVNDELRRMKK